MDTITGAGTQMETLADFITRNYEADGYECQQYTLHGTDKNGMIIQISNTSENGFTSMFKSITGSCICATLKLILLPGGDMQFEVSRGKWLDKVVLLILSFILGVYTVRMGVGLIFWIVTITSAIGLVRQKRLLNSLREKVVFYFAGIIHK